MKKLRSLFRAAESLSEQHEDLRSASGALLINSAWLVLTLAR